MKHRRPARLRWSWFVAGAVAASVLIGIGVVLLLPDGSELDPSLAIVTAWECRKEGAEGLVENRSDEDATAVIEVEFLAADGTFLHMGSVTRPGMAPGEVKRWEILFRPDLAPEGLEDANEDCAVTVPRLFRFER